jgi:hypothetical protein
VIGVERLDTRAIAVSVDEGRKVRARAAVDSSGDLSTAVRAALQQATIGPNRSGALGIACAPTDSPLVAPALKALARRIAAAALP